MPRLARLALGPLLLLALAPVGGVVRADQAGAKAPRPGVPDPELQKRIDEAIDRGAAYLREQQKQTGSLGGMTVLGQPNYEIGATALGALALLAAGDRRGDESVDKAYAFLRSRDELRGQAGSRSTYDAGTLLMFLTDYWRGDDVGKAEKGTTRARGQSKHPCNLPEKDQKWVQELADWLVRVRQAATATWGYPAHRDDHSNTQYAYLGLRAARDCGARIPSQVFLQGLQTLLERQEPDGPKVPRIEPSPDPDASPYVMDAGDRARGWSYLQDPFLATGSMTTAGIAVLAICNDALLNPKRVGAYTSQMELAVQRGAQDGFAWLDKNFSVERNPGGGGANWHLYYLYGLERACILGGRDLLGLHDWYVEGARYLVTKQHSDGHWATGVLGDGDVAASDVVDTAWAVLFLARATRPAPPLRAPVVTEGD